jgi:putative membrane-bound dehydrogenase-like protein
MLRSSIPAIIPALALIVWTLPAAAPPSEPPSLGNKGPLSPAEEKATFLVPKGFKVELVACEPNVVDPVAMAFDENGRIFVAEMRGYPNEGVATGTVTSGQIRLLEDTDGDGFYEKATMYADRLRLPTGVMPYKGGLLAANAPDLIELSGTTDTGKAERRKVLYTGFALSNIQQLLNSLQWGLDNRVHACAGGQGGTITSVEKPGSRPVELRGRGIRFLPDVPGSLEPTSGGGQYGLTADTWGRWFTATNSQHLRHIILPDHYLRRNPNLAVSAVTLDIPEHGAACKVFRRSPFEAWRVERTTRRAGGPDAARFPSTELVPGGYVTSGCSPLCYTADVFPERFRGNVFVCDPANNLILRDVLHPLGATFRATRAEEDRDTEFFSSTDNWCRPVHLTLGPDGGIYVLDFYREVIETPLSLPDDIKKRLNLESRGRGRIWRIIPEGAPRRRPALAKESARELVSHLGDANSWWRLTAQRLLVERQDRTAIEPLTELARKSAFAPARMHALCTLDGLRALTDELVLHGLRDPEAGVREQALRLADERLIRSGALRGAVAALTEDPSPRVRFQVAFTLGSARNPAFTEALAELAHRDDNDLWTQTAILSSLESGAIDLLDTLTKEPDFRDRATPGRLAFLTRLAALVGTRAGEAELGRVLSLLNGREAQPYQIALLDGLGQGLQNTDRPLGRLWDAPPAGLAKAVTAVRGLFEQAKTSAGDEKRPLAERVEAVRLLGRGPFAILKEVVPGLLTPRSAPELQLAAVRALAVHDQGQVPGLLLAGWVGYSPAVRREVVEALFARPARLEALLTALEKKTILMAQLEPARLSQLRRHPSARVRERALAALAGQVLPERGQVVERYRPVLELAADVGRGKVIFQKNCATCHRLEGVGVEVGPDLLSALRNKSREGLLTDILDPSREVDPRYLSYNVTTTTGRTLSGLIAAETASSVTLRRGEKVEETVLRSQIDTIEATNKSLMPEGLEAQVSKQDMADLIAYLMKVGGGK